MPKPLSPGLLRQIIPVPGNNAAKFTGTGAVDIAVSVLPGFRCWLEKLAFLTDTVGASAGSQTYRLRKGNASGVIVATLVLALADTDAIGEYKEASVAASSMGAAYLSDTDTFSITRDAGGTAFGTAPVGGFFVTVAQQPQSRR